VPTKKTTINAATSIAISRSSEKAETQGGCLNVWERERSETKVSAIPLTAMSGLKFRDVGLSAPVKS
jgi:hypothetical protein